jgi:hypothetical protein
MIAATRITTVSGTTIEKIVDLTAASGEPAAIVQTICPQPNLRRSENEGYVYS